MTTRTTEVKLKLSGIDEYVAGQEAAAKSTDKTDRAVEGLDRDVKKIPPDAAKAAAALKLLGVETATAGDKVRGFGTTGTPVVKEFENRIKALRQEVQLLAADFQRTGSVQAFQNLLRGQSQLRDLERLAATLTPAFRTAGMQAGGAMTSGIGEVLGAAAPALVPAAVALVAEVFAAAGGATLAATGMATLIGGSIIQAKTNPVVQHAAADFGNWLMTELADASSPLVPYMMQGFKILEGDLAPVMTELKRNWSELAPYVKIFATYVGIAAEKLGPGFAAAFSKGMPALAAFAQELPYLAEAVSHFFISISSGSKGATEALVTLTHAIGVIIVGTGNFIRAGEDVYSVIVKIAQAITDFGAKAGWWLGPAGAALKALKPYVDNVAGSYDRGANAAAAFGDVNWSNVGTFDAMSAGLNHTTTALNDQVAAVDGLTQAWDKYFGLAMSVDEASLNLHKSITELSDSVLHNGRTWDLNTQAGQNNYGALLHSIQAAKDAHDAQLANGESLQQTNANYQAQVKVLIDWAQKMGLSAAAVQQLNIQFASLGATIASMGGKISDPGHLAKVLSQGKMSQLGQGLRAGGIVSFADAGIYRDSMGPLIQFAEPGTGMEGFVPQRGITHARAGQILSPMAGWHGYGVVDYARMRSAPAGGGGSGGGTLVVQLIDPQTGQVTRQTLIKDALRRNVPQASVQTAYP